MASGSSMPTGPPYIPQSASFGGRPTTNPDVAVSAVFIAFYALLGILHSRIYRMNKAAGHFFIFSGLIFGFCMSRVTTFVMRLLSAQSPTSIGLAIAANVLISSGVLLLFVTNMNFAQRLVRAFHPRFYDSKPFKYAFLAYYISLVAVLIMVIATTVQSFYTLNHSILKTDLSVRRFGVMWFLIFTFAPIPMVLVAKFTSRQPQNFGKMGSLQTKVIIVLAVATILTISTGVRASATLAPARPATDPAWYEKKAAFYIFLPALEVIIVAIFAITRVDQRFFVPGKAEREREAGPEKIPSLTADGRANV